MAIRIHYSVMRNRIDDHLKGVVRGRIWVCDRAAPAILVLGLLVSGCASSPQESSVAESPPRPYLRKSESADGTLSLEVGVRSFAAKRGRGPIIWLVGVTHLGEKRYYDDLQHFLEGHSLVLYEGIGATNGEFRVESEGSYSLQESLAEALGLEFQVNAIDYDPAHFQNSDVTLAELERLFLASTQAASGAVPHAELDQLILVMEGRGWLGAIARLGTRLLAASPRLQAATKVVLVEVLSSLPADLGEAAFVPAGLQRLLNVLIDERNEIVLDDLQRALQHSRPPPESIALFYGAGHMADLETRLRDTLHYRPAAERWFVAFAVNPAAAGMTDFELGMMRTLVQQQLQLLQETQSSEIEETDQGGDAVSP